MGYLKAIGTFMIYIGFYLAVITFLPSLPPEAEYSEYSIKFPLDTPTQFELKNRLQGAKVLFPGEIKGPESFASFNGQIYTGIRGGYVVEIEENRIKPIVKFGQKCDGLWQEEKCGRPLGLKFNDKGELFVADAYYGIFKVNVNTQQYTNIVNSSETIDGKIPKLVNSLDIAKNGDIYWTDSSIDFYLYDGIYSFLANPSGRLIRYNAATKKNEVLLRNLGFANGILLSSDESFVIVLETLTSRIIKYNLKGSKAGLQEIFAEGLPGLPDNVHSDGQGGFLVSLIITIDSQHPFLPQSLIPHPYIRKMLSRLFYSIEVPFKLLQDIYPNYYSERVLHAVGSMDVSNIIEAQQFSVILRMDKTGKVLDTLYSEGDFSHISSAYIHNGYLWFGSPWNDYIMRAPLKQAFPDLVVNAKPSATKQKEPLLTASATPNIKVEAKSTKSVTEHEATTKSIPKSTVKIQTTEKSKSTTPKSATSQSTTTTPKPPSSPPPSKVLTKESKKDNLKEIKKDDVKNLKKDNFKSQTEPEVLKKGNEALPKPKSESVKKNVRETQSEKSMPVKKSDSTKK